MKKVKRKRCKECEQLFTPTFNTVQMVCSPICAIKYSKRLKSKQNDDLQDAFIEKKQKETLSTLLKNTVSTCHLYIRLRDKHKPCISCGCNWHKDFHAGHFYKAELFSTIKFNEYNINGQCQKCNLRKEGNESEYSVNLPKRIGTEAFEELDYLASLEKQTNFKWDRQELIKIRNYYKRKIKEL